VPASLRILELLDDLTYEFQALGVHSRQVLTLVLGLKLRQWGHLSVQNENDLLQSELAVDTSESAEKRISRLLATDKDALTQINERFKEQTNDIRSDWNTRLRVEPTSIDTRVSLISEQPAWNGMLCADPGKGTPP
jgi:hypothetical protein